MTHNASRPFALAEAVVVIVAVLGCVGCGAGPEPRDQASVPTFYHPPPKMGSSITHTKMCTCKSCPERSCCQGEQEKKSKTCDQSYDFSGDCGLEVSSCSARCTQHVWRVRTVDSCDAHLPAECC